MTDKMCTWHSKNSPAEQQWLGYVYLGGNRLPIACFGHTEDEVKAKMRNLYAENKEERDKNRARREADRQKRAERELSAEVREAA